MSLRTLGAPKILNLRKFFAKCLKFDKTFYPSTRVFLEYIFNRSVLIIFLIDWPTVPLGAPIILNLQRNFTDYFQNLAQRFIRIQKCFNKIIFLKKNVALRPPEGSENLKTPEDLYRLLLHF